MLLLRALRTRAQQPPRSGSESFSSFGPDEKSSCDITALGWLSGALLAEANVAGAE